MELEKDNAELKGQLTEYEEIKAKFEQTQAELYGTSTELSTLKSDMHSQQTNFESRIESLQKEIIGHNMASQQKDADIKTLTENVKEKEEMLANNKEQLKDFESTKNKLETVQKQNDKLATDYTEAAGKISELEKRILNEQETSKQTEDELIQARIEVDNLRLENEKLRVVDTPERLQDLSEADQVKLLKLRDQEIDHLKSEIEREQQIVAHVQITQEKEIIEKEREISVLQSVLAQERQLLAEKEKELAIFKVVQIKENGFQIPFGPSRPKRTKSSNSKDDAPMEQPPRPESAESSDTVTFHDALSEEEDILIEDIEDMELEEDKHRQSDIMDIEQEDLSLG